MALQSWAGAWGVGSVFPAQLRVCPVLRGWRLYHRHRDNIQQLRRSDPAASELRTEFQKQSVGYSVQGEFIKCVEQKTDAYEQRIH